MDLSIRLRTAEDDLADKRAALKALVTITPARPPKQVKRGVAKRALAQAKPALAQPADGA